MRVKDLIFKAGDLTEDAYLPKAELIRTDKDRRKRTIYLNIAEAMSGNPEANIRVQNEDRLIVHSVWETKWKEFVHIRGKVKKPGRYDLTKGMRLSDLIFKAGGLTRGAYLEEGELVRYKIVDGKKVVSSLINFRLGAALKEVPADNLPLQAMDVIHIKIIPGWLNNKRTVTIAGEVLFPGTYQVMRNERLSDILERAGGFTKESYLRAAFFTRESVRKKQKKELTDLIKRLEIDMASLGALENEVFLSEEALRNRAYLMAAQNSLLRKLKEKKPTGRVIISLVPVEKLINGPCDLLLEAGDRLFIPKNPNTVHVLGAVYSPITAVYEKERGTLSYYLDKAGGPTENAQTDQIFIVRTDGSVVSKSSRPERFEETLLYPWDSIIVPHRGIRPVFLYSLAERAQRPN
ncbi:MAG TPA: hypothetical protein ENH70_09320 [Desulfobacteraceae bacterium]|nr:hypothetical protein [Desulfobacteraceae bacterium]